MSVQLNHTIIATTDNRISAQFWADVLGLAVAGEWGPFVQVNTDNGVGLDFAKVPEGSEISPQHYAFLVTDEVFDAGFAFIRDMRVPFWGDPRKSTPGEINTNDGGRGVYFEDPDGHFMELITVPYGGWK